MLPPLSVDDARTHLAQLLQAGARVLFTGASGLGKTTLITQLATPDIPLIWTDPGRPVCGPCGAIGTARWHTHTSSWHPEHIIGLATMDCARFRAPLLCAAAELAADSTGHLLVDTPGFVRGLGALELITGLARMTRCDTAVLLTREGDEPPPFLQALEARGLNILFVHAHPDAERPSPTERHKARRDSLTAHWGDTPEVLTLPRRDIPAIGAPPPDHRWTGHIVALLDAAGATLGLGRIERADATTWHIAASEDLPPDAVASLLARDMGIDPHGRVRTMAVSQQEDADDGPQIPSSDAPTSAYTQRPKPNYRLHLGKGPVKRGGSIRTKVVGSLFEDPMVVLRLDHRQRCLFFDLGEVAQVPTKIVHQTTDIFLTHAHLDHFGDFPWLLRRLIGHTTPLTIWGPPGTIERVDHMVHAFTWDRIGARGPRFDVREIHHDTLHRAHIQAGLDGHTSLDPIPFHDGMILEEPRQIVRAAPLDHGGTTSIAYAIHEPNHFDVRGNVLRQRGWQPGPWLGDLKRKAATRRFDDEVHVEVVDGDTITVDVRTLTEDVLISSPGQKIVYATDFANTPANRDAVIALADKADVFFCEASFREEERAQAERTGHLCARDCAEIAAAADVGMLVPFHLSIRYEDDPAPLYQEILEVFERTLVPRDIL